MADEKSQINFQINAVEVALVDRFAKEDGFDNRSAWIRRLVRQEISRRSAQKVAEDAEPMPIINTVA